MKKHTSKYNINYGIIYTSILYFKKRLLYYYLGIYNSSCTFIKTEFNKLMATI